MIKFKKIYRLLLVCGLLLLSFTNVVTCDSLAFKLYKNEEEIAIEDKVYIDEDGYRVLLIDDLQFDNIEDEYRLEILDPDAIVELANDDVLMFFTGVIDGKNYEKEEVYYLTSGIFTLNDFITCVPSVVFKSLDSVNNYFSLPKGVVNLDVDKIDNLDISIGEAYAKLINGLVYQYAYKNEDTDNFKVDDSLRSAERIIDEDGSIVYNLEIKKELDKSVSPFITLELLCYEEYLGKRVDIDFVKHNKMDVDEIDCDYSIDAEYILVDGRKFKYDEDKVGYGLRLDLALNDFENKEKYPDFSLRLRSLGDKESDFIYVNVKILNDESIPEIEPVEKLPVKVDEEEVKIEEKESEIPREIRKDYKSPDTACKNFIQLH